MAAKDRDRFSTTARIRLLGERTAARAYRSQSKRQARRSRLTGRAALLALVVCSMVVALAYPMRQYVAQRAEIADLQEESRRSRDRVEELGDLAARWQDDAFAAREIRARLHYVRPGETGYVMRDPEAAERARADREASGRPWWRTVLDGVDRVDAAGR
ncbi:MULTISPECIES: FtsB family cell division protein [unclassified Streptomyces]|uniref:FtsB family cell division protein n=1 Tax=unclassified Streptomyces TaxID=2593676 RepID=UPI0019070605|nr:septum formation initiator family protein [Streptomyces sp. HSG2]